MRIVTTIGSKALQTSGTSCKSFCTEGSSGSESSLGLSVGCPRQAASPAGGLNCRKGNSSSSVSEAADAHRSSRVRRGHFAEIAATIQ